MKVKDVIAQLQRLDPNKELETFNSEGVGASTKDLKKAVDAHLKNPSDPMNGGVAGVQVNVL